MKNKWIAAAVYGGAGIGLLRAADYAFFTDAETGFVTVGGVWLRYLLLFAPVVLGVLAARTLPQALARAPYLHPTGSLLLRVAGGCMGVTAAVQLISVFLGEATAETLAAPLLAVFALWLLAGAAPLTVKHTVTGVFVACGALGSFAFCVYSVNRFIAQPSSLQRIAPQVYIFSAVCAMMFVCCLLQGLHYSQFKRSGARKTARYGLMCFYVCTCLALPQSLISALRGGQTPADIALAVSLGALGVYGLYQAVTLAQHAQDDDMQPAEEEPEEKEKPKKEKSSRA